jgi:hypothetical protein
VIGRFHIHLCCKNFVFFLFSIGLVDLFAMCYDGEFTSLLMDVDFKYQKYGWKVKW